MKYTEYLKSQPKDFCPFCKDEKDRVFIENEFAFLTYGKAPYHRHHLLVVPKEHRSSFLELSKGESDAMWDLIRKGAAILLELGYETYTMIVREGKGGAKSVEHLHYHVIPVQQIGDLDADINIREIMTVEEEKEVIEEIDQAIRQMAFRGL
jgi:diadenosine tetraphosphate (Ap4A) HIT family hydrolase